MKIIKEIEKGIDMNIIINQYGIDEVIDVLENQINFLIGIIKHSNSIKLKSDVENYRSHLLQVKRMKTLKKLDI